MRSRVGFRARQGTPDLLLVKNERVLIRDRRPRRDPHRSFAVRRAAIRFAPTKEPAARGESRARLGDVRARPNSTDPTAVPDPRTRPPGARTPPPPTAARAARPPR